MTAGHNHKLHRVAKTDLAEIADDETEDLKNCCCGVTVVWIIMWAVLPALVPSLFMEGGWADENMGSWVLISFAFAPLAIFNLTQISDLAE